MPTNSRVRRIGLKVPQTKKSQPRRKKKNRSKRRRNYRGKRDGSVLRYAQMVSDPCNAPLVKGIYGTSAGVTTRFQSSITQPSVGTETCGYVIWFPSYASPYGGITYGNLFTWNSALASTRPLNNNTQGYGTNGADTTRVVQDPTYAFMNGAVCDSARVIGACMKMSYTGKMQDSSGQIAVLQNITLDNIMKGSLCASVDDLFILASHSRRLGIDTHEVVYRPVDAGMDRFRDITDNCLNLAKPTFAEPDAQTYHPTCFGFAYRGITAGTADQFIIEFHKNLEWKPATGQGMPMVPVTAGDEGRNYMKETLSYLDNISPGWWDQTVAASKSAAAQIVQTALTGQLSKYTNPFGRRTIRNGL